MGYHYPRSLTTAVKSADYFNRFVEDFGFCIYQSFEQIYAISEEFSWTNAEQFVHFCRAANIECEEVKAGKYFNENMCQGAFLTKEYTYDAMLLQQYFMDRLMELENVTFLFSARIDKIVKKESMFDIFLKDKSMFQSEFVFNATYASTNQVLNRIEGMEAEKFDLKYELCEIILCTPSPKLENIGITVMDGPFFSIMPFGRTGFHSLTSVTFTPHITSYASLPTFHCQQEECDKRQLCNCNECPSKPSSTWPYMSHLANKYMKEDYTYHYNKSLFSMKPILKTSEIDDSRPTAIKVASKKPTFISVLSGKINTVYDLDQFLS